MTESFLAPLLSEKAERKAVSSHALNCCLQLVFCSFNLSLRSHQLHLADRAASMKSSHDSEQHIPQPALVKEPPALHIAAGWRANLSGRDVPLTLLPKDLPLATARATSSINHSGSEQGIV